MTSPQKADAAKPEAPFGWKRSLGSLADHVGELIAARPRLAGWVFALQILRTGLEFYGFILLIPALKLLGLGGGLSAVQSGGVDLSALADPLHSSLGPSLVAGLFLGLVVLRSAGGYLGSVLASRWQAAILHEVRLDLYRAMARAKWSHLVAQSPSRLTAGLVAKPEVIAYDAINLTSCAGSALSLLAAIAAALMISWELTLISMAAAVLIALPVVVFDIKLYRVSQRAVSSVDRLYEQIGRRLGQLKLVRILSADETFQGDFDAVSRSYSEAVEQHAETNARIQAVHEVIGACALAGLAYWAMTRGVGLSAEPAALTLIFTRVITRANQLQASARSLLQALPYYRSYRDLLDELVAADEGVAPTPATPGGDPKLRLRKKLRLENVSFSYAGPGQSPALRDVTLEIAAGTATGVIGLNGAGKTTFLDILAGLHRPTIGRVRVDEVDVALPTLAAWRGSVSYALQDDCLFDDTIAANMRLAAPRASDDEIWRALDLAGAADFVRSRPEGLQTRAGEGGRMLSRGERQRLSLARALLLKPSLLLIDEGTSALNPVDEATLNATFRRLLPEITIIAVSHRPSVLDWVDQVLVFEEGRLRRAGTLANVMAEPGGLMARMQSGGRKALGR